MVETLPATGAAAFVGREAEIEELRQLLSRALAGSSSIALLGGMPGIGKSALLLRAAELAAQQGFSVAWGRCWEAGGAPAYWPWSQALGTAVNTSDVPAELTGKLASILPDQPADAQATAEGDPAAARFRLFAAVAETLRVVSEKRPLLILLDDLHLADEPSLLLLRFIATDREQGRIALIGAFRDPDTEAAPEWRPPPALLDLARQPRVKTIRLGGLASRDVADFIVATTGRDPEQNLVHQVHQETEGNPLFMGEIVRLLEYEGRLAPGQRLDLLGTRLPPTVSEAISRRLRHVSSECRNLLALASVLGRDFELGALAALKGRPRQDMEPLLREAARARLTLDVGTGSVRGRFSHALIRDALYQMIPVERRRALHLAAGNALEALYDATLDEHLAELAFHYVSSGEATRRDRGIDFARRAAGRAVDQLAFEEGVRLYRLALDTTIELAPSDLDTRGELLLALGDAQARSGDTSAAQRSFLAAADTARRLGDTAMLARAALGYGGRLVWATPRGDPNLIPLLREALDKVEDDGLRCRLLARLSGALREDFEMTERDRLSREAVQIARSLNDPLALAYALSARYPAVWGPDNLDERFAIGSELLGVGLEVVDKERIFHGHTQRLYVELERGDMAAAREDFAGAARIARDLSQPSQLWLVGAIEAELAIFEGRLVDAERLAYRAHALGLRASRSSADIAFAMQLFVLRRQQQRTTEIGQLIQATIDSYASAYPVLFALEVLAAAELGDSEKARALLDSLSRDEFAALPRNDEWLPALTLVAEALPKLPDAEKPARWLYETTQGYADRNVLGNPELLYGSHARTLGLLAISLGEIEAAIDHLQQAVTANRRWGGALWTACAELDLAAVLIRRGGDADGERARSLLQAAAEASVSLPSRRLELEVNRLSQELDSGSLQRAARPAASLFRREGDSWHIEFEGVTLRLRNTLGLQYISRLLARPGQEIHALDLASQSNLNPVDARPGHEPGMVSAPAPPETVIDAAARSAYKTRLDELEAEINEAELWNDLERAAHASEEKDFLLRELAGALGLGGAPRRVTDPGERARQSATKAVKAAIQRISRDHKELGQHLRATVRTGIYFSYSPDPRLPPSWQVD